MLRDGPDDLSGLVRNAETIKTWIMEPDARPELERLAKEQAAEAEGEKEAGRVAGGGQRRKSFSVFGRSSGPRAGTMGSSLRVIRS